MPTFDLVLSAEEHENVGSLTATPGRHWPIKIRCAKCNEVTKNFIFVDATEQTETEGGGVRNCVFRCTFCKNIITADVVPITGSASADGYTLPVELEGGSGNDVVATFDFRGGAPEELRLDDQWNVTSAAEESPAVFTGVDLSEDWCEFDEKAGVPVTLSGVTAEFVKGKNKK